MMFECWTSNKITFELTLFNISTRFHGNESFGLLVLLGFDITALTPVAYQGRSLQPPL